VKVPKYRDGHKVWLRLGIFGPVLLWQQQFCQHLPKCGSLIICQTVTWLAW
jgi:hypothetical protein